jgi:tetratricopeptide (TPR) repeat protein
VVNYNDIKDLSVEELIRLSQKYFEITEYTEAERILCELLDLDSGNPQALFLLGKIYSKMERKGLAETLFRRSLESSPTRSEIWGSIGNSIDPYFRGEEAEKYLRKAIQLNPENEAALVNLSNTLCLNGRFQEAKEVAKTAIDFQPESIAGHDNYGMACLALGEWSEGWDNVEWALGHGYRPETQFGDEDRWEGEKGKDVICYSLQGLGDEILYGSCLPDLIEDCGHVILECDPRLEGLFRRSFPEISVYGTRKRQASWPNDHTWDARVSNDTLPRFYRRSLEEFPGVPFLKADPVRRLQWKAVLDSISDRPKIGISWKGGGKLTARRKRSVDVELFESLSEIGDLIDLSYDKNDHKGVKIHQWDHATLTDNYDDTAGLVAELDAVVSVCTGVIHLAGALGKSCHVLVPEVPSWRYATEMPWYDSVKLHRNKGDWKSLINQVKDDLIGELND